MDYREITIDVEERIATITLNRPEKLNAFTDRMAEELLHGLDRIDEDDGVRVVIVTGAGRAFCAGADLSSGGDTFDAEAQGGEADIHTHRDTGGRVTLRLYDLKKPVIAAVNGAAVGIGSTLQLPMDVRIASDRARFGFVFTRRGIVPEAASSWFLPRLVGMSRAQEWVLTGRVFSAEEALAGGLVSRVVPADRLIEEARTLAREIVENTSAVSTALARQLLWKMAGADHPMVAHRIDSKSIAWMGRSPDAFEGVASFLEKRPARFPLAASEMPEFYPWWPERSFEGDDR